MVVHVVVINCLAAIWILLEVWLLRRDRARGKGKTDKDRGTIYFNFIALAVGTAAAGILSGQARFFFPGGRTNAVFVVGVAIMALGLALRVWAIWSLGASFRMTVETHENQKVKKDGLYRLIRHPSYSGLVVITCGYGIAVQNWLSLVIAVALPLVALLYRIHVEEAFLVQSLGEEYREYQKHTKRLIPWVW